MSFTSTMIIERCLDTGVDLFDPNEIYTRDIDELLIKKLEHRYKNRCFQNMFITDIVKINERSEVIMSRTQLNGSAYIDVNFQVRGIVLQKDEILHGCEVFEIFENGIMARHATAVVKIDISQNTIASSVLKKGQKIPVLVNKVRYAPYHQQISVIGVVYMPYIPEQLMYRVNSPLTPEETEKIAQALDHIESEEKTLDTNAKTYDFFQDLMYPYKTTQKVERMPLYEHNKFVPIKLNIKDIVSLNSGLISYPALDPRQNKRFLMSKQKHINSITIVETSMYSALSNILNQYLMYLTALKGFVLTYKNPDDMKSLLTYWKICKSAKV